MDFQTPKMWAALAYTCVMLIQTASGDAVPLERPCMPGTDTCSAAHSECIRYTNDCDMGACMCRGDYDKVLDNGAEVCKRKRSIGDTCSADTDSCIGGGECKGTPTKCACPDGEEFKTQMQLCMTTAKRLLGEECTELLDCFSDFSPDGSMKCATKEGGGDKKYCQCKATYQMIPQFSMCRLQIKEEICDTSTAKCKCPPETTYKTFKEPNPDYSVTDVGACIADLEAGVKQKEAKAVCTTMNQCEDGLVCGRCSGLSERLCVQAGTGSSDTVTVSLSLMAFSMLLRFW